MGISLKGSAGAWAAGTTASAPAIPTHAADDVILVTVIAKPTATGTPPVFSTPSGWTMLASDTNFSGAAQAADAGQTWAACYYRIATAPGHTISVGVTNGNVTLGRALVFQKDALDTWVTPVAAIGGDSSLGTAFSIAAGITLAEGDMIVADTGLAGNNVTFGAAWTLASTGSHTFGAVTKAGSDGTTNNGNDLASSGCYGLVATGASASVTVTASNTLTGAQTGVGSIARLRVTTPDPIRPNLKGFLDPTIHLQAASRASFR